VLPRIGGKAPLRAAAAETASPDPAVQSAASVPSPGGPTPRRPRSCCASPRRRRAGTSSAPRSRATHASSPGRACPSRRRSPRSRRLLPCPVTTRTRRACWPDRRTSASRSPCGCSRRCLERPGLRDAAAAALFDLASRQSPEQRWLSGHEAHSVLRRAEASLSDPAARERRTGSSAIDCGRAASCPSSTAARSTLEGPRGRPAEEAKMAPRELSSAQAAADETMRATGRSWTESSPSTEGESLCTTSDYGDFELLADWKIEKGGDSGFYLRGSPQVQIWTPWRTRPGRAAFSTTRRGRRTAGEADLPVGEWNAFRVLMIGERVTVYLNDKRVVDNTFSRTTGSGTSPSTRRGRSSCRPTATRSGSANLFVRMIPRESVVPPAVTDVEDGFTPLFNGHDLEAGRARPTATCPRTEDRGPPRARRGEPVHGEGVHGLRPAFRLQADAGRQQRPRHPRPPRGRRRLRGDGAPDPRGRLTRVLGLQPYQYHGSVYGVVPARRGVLRPVGEWNSERSGCWAGASPWS